VKNFLYSLLPSPLGALNGAIWSLAERDQGS
jgi:hypothetical protein